MEFMCLFYRGDKVNYLMIGRLILHKSIFDNVNDDLTIEIRLGNCAVQNIENN